MLLIEQLTKSGFDIESLPGDIRQSASLLLEFIQSGEEMNHEIGMLDLQTFGAIASLNPNSEIIRAIRSYITDQDDSIINNSFNTHIFDGFVDN